MLPTMARSWRTNKVSTCISGLMHAGAILFVLILSREAPSANCEAKEFDWSDLGVSLAAAKSAATLGSNSGTNNLRILVSPQRRMTKNYEFDYTTNSSQPNVSSSGETSYVVAGSSPYLAQSVYQLSPNHSVHSSAAYSALSASLASLKNRLSARGVTLTSTLGDSGTGSQSSGHLYTNSNSYGPSTVMIDSTSQQQQAQQQHQQVQQQQQQQQQLIQAQAQQQSAQPTYLSVSSQQDQQITANTYTVPPSQSNENKTIVLAIPAKINFLTGTKQQSQQQQVQPQTQQLSVLQATNEQPTRAEYATKQQLGVISSQEASIEQVGNSEPQEQHQYVIVNQPSGDHHSHSVAASLNPTATLGTNGQVYSTQTIYQPSIQQSSSGYSMKYVPTYTQTQQPGGTIQKVYSVIEPQTVQAPTTTIYEPQQIITTTNGAGEQSSLSTTRYTTCLDTCNSADPRWRKYTVSKYRACCSRSSQFDAAFELPSADRVSDTSAKYADDAYYNYLYRKSRAKRSRRQRSRQNGQYYGRYQSNVSGAEDESLQGVDGVSSVLPVAEGRTVGSNRASHYNQPQEYPYMKYYKNRGAYLGQAAPIDAPITDQLSGRDEAPATSSSRYSTKERSYRRARSRDLDAPLDQPNSQPATINDNVDDDSVAYSRETMRSNGGAPLNSPTAASNYGGGEYSVDTQNRAYLSSSDSRGPLVEEDESTRYDESMDGDQNVAKQESSESVYQSDAHPDSSEESELDSSGPAYKYPSRRRKHQNAGRARSRKMPAANKELVGGKYYKKNRKNKYGKPTTEYLTQSSNATEYESSLSGDYHQTVAEPASGAGLGDQDEQTPSYQSKENSSNGASYTSGNNESDGDRETTLAKYRASLNDTTVANLSKTTMHLKEILLMLEKKANLRSNDTSSSSQQQQQQQQITATSTVPPPPPTTTASIYPISSLLGGSQYSSPLSSDFLSSDLSLKSPYRFDPTTLSSSLNPAPLTLPSSFSSSFGSDPLSLAPSYPSNHYSLHSNKHLNGPNGHHQRKRRPNKNVRYNDLMFTKAAHGLSSQPSLLQAAAKNRIFNPVYYAALQYPYLYRGGSPTITNPYPYKNIHKNPYSSLLGGPVASKLAAAASSSGLYTDESRLHSLTNLDPLANMASSLRPSGTMRLRTKPFVFQPQVLPIYTRHTILTQPLDVKA